MDTPEIAFDTVVASTGDDREIVTMLGSDAPRWYVCGTPITIVGTDTRGNNQVIAWAPGAHCDGILTMNCMVPGSESGTRYDREFNAILRGATFHQEAIAWPDGITDEQKAQAIADLGKNSMYLE